MDPEQKEHRRRGAANQRLDTRLHDVREDETQAVGDGDCEHHQLPTQRPLNGEHAASETRRASFA
jgi:hypothetical protein